MLLLLQDCSSLEYWKGVEATNNSRRATDTADLSVHTRHRDSLHTLQRLVFDAVSLARLGDGHAEWIG
jgi:hypothetical protein